MRKTPHHSSLVRRCTFEAATRQVIRRCWRSCIRFASREVWRIVIPYGGPSLSSICALISRYIRLTEAYHKKWNPAPCKPRFQLLCSPEESRRRFEQDLERCYGSKSP